MQRYKYIDWQEFKVHVFDRKNICEKKLKLELIWGNKNVSYTSDQGKYFLVLTTLLS